MSKAGRQQERSGAWSVEFSAAAWLAVAAFACPSRASADVLELTAKGTIVIRASDRPLDAVSAAGPELIDAVQLPPEAITPLTASLVPTAFAQVVEQVADAHQISPALLEALVWQESRWRPGARSTAGAIGLAQLMPATARELGVDPQDPGSNLAGGARYLRQQLDRFDGDIERALAAYNAGPGRVQRAGGIPMIAETRNYVRTVVDRLSGSTVNQGKRP
ncbi:lytic transglycosylase domain-containing protein [Sphingomonas sp. BN140010]|uniref:Lytic transglycosylase domain-containing protein n=1 Tax=Sphingomonas arvum TaxID=2992113 RepID=A0ABT3JCT6_9SPHN|nr:lytic transglycosylase domain-containing protein [Sphingomonas sp. BN140010]MCW3796890.1 lytic transglycosylase domain-containing protein [Sphingomonas sp. BN140010]